MKINGAKISNMRDRFIQKSTQKNIKICMKKMSVWVDVPDDPIS